MGAAEWSNERSSAVGLQLQLRGMTTWLSVHVAAKRVCLSLLQGVSMAGVQYASRAVAYMSRDMYI